MPTWEQERAAVLEAVHIWNEERAPILDALRSLCDLCETLHERITELQKRLGMRRITRWQNGAMRSALASRRRAYSGRKNLWAPAAAQPTPELMVAGSVEPPQGRSSGSESNESCELSEQPEQHYANDDQQPPWKNLRFSRLAG